MHRLRTLSLPALLVAGALAVSGCGSSEDSSSTASSTSAAAQAAPTSTTAPAAASAATPTDGAITVDATEFKFAPTAITAKAGKLEITMKNAGQVPHELVLLKTTTAAGSLKVSDQRVSEDDSVGEISETDGGVSKSHTFTLKPGTYVYVCNIPGHYMDGMRGTLTVQ